MVDGKVIRRTWPTASFSFTVEQLAWIEQEAKRRQISKSELMRALVMAAMTAQDEDVRSLVARVLAAGPPIDPTP